MKVVYSSKYEVDIGNHPLVTKVYRLVKEKLEKEFTEIKFVQPDPATVDVLLKVHTKDYVEKILNLKLNYDEILKLEIPLTKQVVESALVCVNGTILSAELALEQKIGIHIGGGFHHAYADHGEGFCIFNDIACAIKVVEEKYGIKKFAVIDADLHQGNGTAKIFENDKNVFTFSIHQKEIYPWPKEKSTLDIELPAGTEDEEYLTLFEQGLKQVKNFSPEIIFYQSGVDIYENDQLGELKITKSGILQRDKLVYEYFKSIPVVVTLGGGYAFNFEDTVELHYNTIKCFITKLKSS